MAFCLHQKTISVVEYFEAPEKKKKKKQLYRKTHLTAPQNSLPLSQIKDKMPNHTKKIFYVISPLWKSLSLLIHTRKLAFIKLKM
jgi:hypothetical protein